jgi:predicted nucleotidyltransferase component of viral defense system
MDIKIRKAQEQVLNIFSRNAKSFALAGGTALELYYLHHRFSVDLDFFSPQYDINEIECLIEAIKEELKTGIKLENELLAGNKAKVRFYTMPVEGTDRPLKIDFVEDVLFDEPDISAFEKVRVYDAKNIYFQRITAVTGMRSETDYTGREIMQGRMEARDVFDIYMLSKKIEPLHVFLRNVPDYIQRGIIHWYRSFSRTKLKIDLLDMDIYLKDFDAKEMIVHVEEQIKKFIREAVI